MAFICGGLRVLCRGYIRSGKVRDTENKFHRGYGCAHDGHTGLLVSYRPGCRIGRSDAERQREDFCLSHPLGSSNRSLLALLLPCSPGGAGQHRGAHRQAECGCHGSIFLFCLWGKVKPPGAGGTAPSDGRNRGHGIHVKSKTIKRRSLFHRDQVADVRALSGEHIVIELLLPVNVVHTALQLLDGGEEGFSFLHKQELEKWKRYRQQTDF